MKTVLINLAQFPDFDTCSWVKGLISLSKDFFKETEVVDNLLFLSFDPVSVDHENQLDRLCEASSMDFTYKVVNGSIDQIKEVLKSSVKVVEPVEDCGPSEDNDSLYQ